LALLLSTLTNAFSSSSINDEDDEDDDDDDDDDDALFADSGNLRRLEDCEGGV
jgi:hypothetical protein